MTDLDLARLAASAYDAAPAGRVVDYLDSRAVVTEAPDDLTIAIRGTRPDSIEDWIRDASAWPVHHPQLGACHAGFLTAAVGLWSQLRPIVAGRRVRLCGHSMGGGDAVLIAGLMAADAVPPELLVTFEAPRAGGHMLATLLAGVEVRQYRYGNDPVTEVPWVPGVYEHVREPLVAIGAAMVCAAECHFIARTVAWLEAREAVAA